MNPVWHFVNGIPQIGTLRVTPSQVMVGDGTAIAPSYSFASQTTTGFYLHGASQIRWSIVGTERIRIDGSAFALHATSALTWGSSGVTSDDVSLSRGAAGTLTLNSATATPAGGSTALRLVFGSTAGFGIYVGSGAPTVSAAQGSIYLRSDGSSTTTRLYVNTNGTTGWTNVATAA